MPHRIPITTLSYILLSVFVSLTFALIICKNKDNTI